MASIAVNSKSELGEGAIWDSKRSVLLWIDIMGGKFYEFNPATKENKMFDLKQSMGTIVPCASGGVVLPLAKGIVKYNLDTSSVERVIGIPEPDIVENRFNDGKCDPSGRLWVGTVDNFCNKPTGTLYCVHPSGKIESKLSNVTISNGLCWTADATVMYFIDTATGGVDAFDFDNATANISNRRRVVTIPPGMGGADGMVIDSEGKLWVAMWGGGCVARYDPLTGALLRTVPVPALHVTSCAFGGSGLDQLYITTATQGLTEAQKEAYPLSGGLFVVDLSGEGGVTGVPAFEFAG